MSTLETVKVSSRGQIVIPENVRANVGIREGMKLILVEEDGRITIETEQAFLKRVEERNEQIGWMKVAEKSLGKVWNNPKDDKVWSKY